jgi:hypothetical protein
MIKIVVSSERNENLYLESGMSITSIFPKPLIVLNFGASEL